MKKSKANILTETNLDETRPDLKLAVFWADTEESPGSIITLPPDHHVPVPGLPHQDVANGPGVNMILGQIEMKIS